MRFREHRITRVLVKRLKRFGAVHQLKVAARCEGALNEPSVQKNVWMGTPVERIAAQCGYRNERLDLKIKT